MNFESRRSLISTGPNPDYRIDYVIAIEGNFVVAGLEASSFLTLRYVPDRLILEPTAFRNYLDELSKEEWDSLEHAATAILDDIKNELIARWLRVRVERNFAGTGGLKSHSILLEDRQPNWDNPALLKIIESDLT